MNINDTFRRHVIGSDPLINMMFTTVGDNYPPYNLTQETEDRFVIEIAVAGFSQDDINVSQTKNILRIETKMGETTRTLHLEPNYPGYQHGWNSTVIGGTITGSKTVTTNVGQSLSETKPEFPVKVHQGLAKRSFSKQWALAEGWKARGATMKNGILIVTVEYEKPKDEDTIPIQIHNDERQTLKG